MHIEMKEILISTKNLCKSYGNNLILDNINLDIYEGDFTVIMGSSGAGKSTLLYTLSNMDSISKGKVFYKGSEISSYKEKEMAKLRSGEFGFVFQQTYLVSNLTLFENVLVAGYLSKEKNEKQIKSRAVQLLEQMHVNEVKDRLPSQVSGGEGQRAAIARAMILEPGIVFADEPTGALNKKNTEEVLKILSEMNKKGQSILMVTHDVKSAIKGDRILYMEDGKIIDEILLDRYKDEDDKVRECEINNWLSKLEW